MAFYSPAVRVYGCLNTSGNVVLFLYVRVFRLSVIRFGPVFAEKMLFQNIIVGARGFGADGLRKIRHFGDLFQHDGAKHGLPGILAERKNAVTSDQNSRHAIGRKVSAAETFGNDAARVFFIIALCFFFSERAGAGNVAVKIIGVRGAVNRNIAPGLRPRSCKSRMSMRYSAQFRKGAVQLEMSRRVA